MGQAMKRITLLALAVSAIATTQAQCDIDYEASVTGAFGGNNFAPYYIMSNRHGVLTSDNGIIIDAAAGHKLDRSKRWSYAFGVEALAGYQTPVAYGRYDAQSGVLNYTDRSVQSVWLQQLYGQVKYRQVFFQAGLRQEEPALLDAELSSGDLIRGINTRPIPEVSVGFIDFVDIPLTNGWVQIEGRLGYGKFSDNGWMKDHYNYYNTHLTLGSLYTYKRCYFRTKPSMPFSVTVGMQTAGVFGGTTTYYKHGVETSQVKNKADAKAFFDMFFPREGSGEGYYIGNSLGSWDIFLRYRLPNGDTVRGYLQHPFETGSGIGFLNGFDGLWGLEYRTSTRGPLNGIVIEYLDTTNQSGPNHWDPEDNPGTTLPSHTSGGDDYYNNDFYNAYINYGMSIGTPMLPAPIYNRDGYMFYVINRVRGCHVALTGDITPALSYRLMGGYRQGFGTIRQPVTHKVHDTSMMAEVTYDTSRVPGLQVQGQVAFDCGDMLGNRFGAAVTVRYSGNFKIGKK